jgi:NAD(P)-dependent dehydrogenase (short-subunit alcohol dehydrogenase family)
MENVEGKVAFVTGGASGIGLGIVSAFVEAGMSAVIADIRTPTTSRRRSHSSSSKAGATVSMGSSST